MEVHIDNRNGTLWDMSQLITDMSWSTSRSGKPASMSISYIKGALFQDSSFTINNGDIVRVWADGAAIFYGYVFSVETDESDKVKLTAFDQIRYLLTNDTYVLENVTATEVIQRIAKACQLEVGELADTKHKIPSLLQDNKKLLDIILRSLDMTLIATKNIFVLYDDFGKLTLRDAKSWTTDRIVGEGSQMTGISYKASIDDETYNRVKLFRDNEATGKREVYIMQDSKNIAKWGQLQLYKKIDENLNKAQMQERLEALMKLYNREKKTMKVNAVGDVHIRAGMYIPIFAPEQDMEQYMLVDECSQEWSGSGHKMSLTLKVI
ncbi:hypothetical protein M3650_05555 [Paenibacillus sp. MER TA 81-3]|uniref:XkdQ/YqbQ family protein n=1 Tax=Paenibacillus sp. MER TA 81-3 TaxID=2939573 RepID=UPI00203E8233|nr:hypothetical protein [Paenibacillus sp. MER TA 81-3]MCM3338114.1 hypothetical protein [Paenibacillus sp. MER TA 81-3]